MLTIMQSSFIHPDFLLHNDTARTLYHEEAAGLPIIDYHCHLNPQLIATDHRFATITELWLGGDHYKWRALRANGVDERFITGDADDWEKFRHWAATVPYTMRNPLYHWTHLELKTAFGIDTLLCEETARTIYDTCNEMLQSSEYSARGLMQRYHVESVCTTDDPADDLQAHRLIRESGFGIKVMPAWRPDKLMNIKDPAAYQAYILRLGQAAGMEIRTFDQLWQAVEGRMDAFAQAGCRLSDHGVDHITPRMATPEELETLFCRTLAGQVPTPQEADAFRMGMLLFLTRLNARKGWTQQIHFGPLRNTNTRMMRRLGPDTGYDSMGGWDAAEGLALLLDRLDADDLLAPTILYNINPADNDLVATMAGNFQQGPKPGKIQFGSGWWFNDQREGIERQLNSLSAHGLLSRFVGMLTDSRSFLSYPRHEYFRRVLCNLLGNDVETGLLPASQLPHIRQMVRDICYYNARNYFQF